MISQIITWVCKRYKVNRILEKIKNEDTVLICNSQVINNGGTFLPGARVDNQQDDPRKITIGHGTMVAGILLVFKYGGNITIGDNCYVGDHSRIWSGEEVKIGSNVLISHNVNIIDTSAHEFDGQERSDRYADLIKNGPWKEKGNVLTAPIVIGDYAWISFNATILRGVSIGKGSIIAAGSVVTKDVPDFTLVAGNPARIIRNLQSIAQ